VLRIRMGRPPAEDPELTGRSVNSPSFRRRATIADATLADGGLSQAP